MNRPAIVAGVIVLALGVLEFSENESVKFSTSAEDLRRETSEALQAARAHTIYVKEEYQQKVEAKLDELAKGIATLQARAERAGTKGKSELNTMIAELQQRREAARRHVEELKASNAEAWADLKVAMETAMKDLERGYERTRARLGT